MPAEWKAPAFWISIVASVCGALYAAPEGTSTHKLILLGVSVALPQLILKSMHTDNLKALDAHEAAINTNSAAIGTPPVGTPPVTP